MQQGVKTENRNQLLPSVIKTERGIIATNPKTNKFFTDFRVVDMTKARYELAINMARSQKKNFWAEQNHGSRKILWIAGHPVGSYLPEGAKKIEFSMSPKSRSVFMSFMSKFKSHINEIILEKESPYYLDSSIVKLHRNKETGLPADSDELISIRDLNVPWKGVVRAKNQKSYEMLNPGDIFYEVDIKAAYWQIGHRLGYVSDGMYYRYLDNEEPEIKMLRRLCFTMLSRKNEMNYNDGRGKIICDMEVFARMHTNVRHVLYHIIRLACQLCSKPVIAYTADSVSVHATDWRAVKLAFHSLGIEYSTRICRKADGGQYFFGMDKKSFIRKPSSKKDSKKD